MRVHKGVIYIAKCQDFYKIGHTTGDAEHRLSGLQTGNPFRVELVGTIPGTVSQERNLHQRFAHKRERGEWFRLTPKDVDSILTASLHLAPPPPEPQRKTLGETVREWSAQTSEEEKRFIRLERMLATASPEVIAEFVAEVNKIRGAA